MCDQIPSGMKWQKMEVKKMEKLRKQPRTPSTRWHPNRIGTKICILLLILLSTTTTLPTTAKSGGGDPESPLFDGGVGDVYLNIESPLAMHVDVQTDNPNPDNPDSMQYSPWTFCYWQINWEYDFEPESNPEYCAHIRLEINTTIQYMNYKQAWVKARGRRALGYEEKDPKAVVDIFDMVGPTARHGAGDMDTWDDNDNSGRLEVASVYDQQYIQIQIIANVYHGNGAGTWLLINSDTGYHHIRVNAQDEHTTNQGEVTCTDRVSDPLDEITITPVDARYYDRYELSRLFGGSAGAVTVELHFFDENALSSTFQVEVTIQANAPTNYRELEEGKLDSSEAHWEPFVDEEIDGMSTAWSSVVYLDEEGDIPEEPQAPPNTYT